MVSERFTTNQIGPSGWPAAWSRRAFAWAASPTTGQFASSLGSVDAPTPVASATDRLASDAKPPIVEMRGITKRFGAVVANDDVSLTVREGEIHAVLGENGAGKTTLMSILSGMYQPDAGEIFIHGQPVRIASPTDALHRGIGTVYQHFALVPNLTILENVVLGAEGGLLLNTRSAERRVAEMLAEFGLNVSPGAEVRHLAIGQRQRVEIIKVLARGSRVLLLDEPTSVLTPVEVDGLLALLQRLKATGVAVILITHKLEEALSVSDRVTVLRAGKNAGQLSPDDLRQLGRAGAKARVIEVMFGGAQPSPTQMVAGHPIGDPLLRLRGVSSTGDRGTAAVADVSLDLHAGEIVGIAGVDGNGQKELGELIAGQRATTQGQILLSGKEITNRGVDHATRMGIAYVTDDRLHEGSVPSASIADNIVLKSIGRRPFSNGIWLNRRAIEAHARRLIHDFDVRAPGPAAPISLLSGGNIQKLLFARELSLDPTVLVCNKPTTGLDLKTARFVIRALREQADRGKTVLLISSELDEILEICDRIGVMYNGGLVAIVPRAEVDATMIGRAMLSGKTAIDDRVPA